MKNKSRILSLMLVLAMLVGAVMPVFADNSTSGGKTVYKDNSANTDIYAVTSKAGSDYPFYGALNEPAGGVYYGRVGEGGTLPNGQYGLVNKSQNSKESIISFYTSPDDEYSVEYWSYIYGASTSDGKHALLINMNFDYDFVQDIIDGKYDAKLTKDFKYLGSRSYPVFFRFGGEMNDWGKGHGAEYIEAYKHMAAIARSNAPKVALVFSPNYYTHRGDDLENYYPGDDIVDWIGVSLYYNKYPIEGETNFNGWEAFYGVDTYGDAILNIQTVRNLALAHNKPLMATEGGSCYESFGRDATEFAAARVERAMAYMSVVYPEIKAIVYSDTNFYNDDEKYCLRDNKTVAAGFDAGVAANKTLLHGTKGTYSYYTKLSAYDQLWTGDVELAAYTYYSGLDKLTATWTVDGEGANTVSEYPYSFTVKTAALKDGEHTIKVSFSNGATKEYKFFTGKITKAHPFTDIKKTDYFADAVQWAFDNSITNGTTATTFGPSVECSRSQVCTFLWRACGCPEPASTKNPFVDVAADTWYTKAVLWAVETGITNGAGAADTFQPDMLCTNAQIMTFIWRAMGCPDKTDNPASWYSDAVNWADAHNMLKGTYTGTYNPNANCPRCNVVEYLYRYSNSK